MTDAPSDVSAKPDVFLLLTQMEIGGAQKSAIALAHGLHEAGYRSALGFLYDKAGLVEGIRSRVPFQVFDCSAGVAPVSARTPWRAAMAAYRLYRLLRRIRPRIFLGFTPYSNILGGLIAWLARVPVRIGSQRSLLWRHPKWIWTADALLVNHGILHEMIAVAEHVRQFCVEVEGIPADRVSVVQNGVDASQFAGLRANRQAARARRGIPEDGFVILCLGRLDPPKGFDVAVRAMPIVVSQLGSALLLFVGDGPARRSLEELVDQLSLVGSVRFDGATRDIRPYLAAADLFVLASRWEGCPNALLEAMAAGLAVIGTRIGGVSELITHGETGWLVDGENPEALARAILQAAASAAERQAMGDRAREFVQAHFTERQTVERYQQAFARLGRLHASGSP